LPLRIFSHQAKTVLRVFASLNSIQFDRNKSFKKQMKMMKHLLIIGLVLCISQVRAQQVYSPDVIWYNTGKNIYLQFSLPSIYDLNHFADASKIFSDLYSESTQQQLKSLNEHSGISVLLNKKVGKPTITEGRSSIAC
jgi:hypothetical protein